MSEKHWSIWLERHPVKKKSVDFVKVRPQDNFSHDSPIEAKIDLHYLTQKEALQELENFLAYSCHLGRRKVLIIHGKGNHSDQGSPVLKPLVAQHLTQSQYVRATGRARLKDGGTGATWAILRS